MQTLILDSSQISAWSECSQMWANRGLIAINKNNPEETLRPGEAIAAGSLMHKYLEIYYETLAATQDPKLAAQAALGLDPDETDVVDKQFPLDPEMRNRVRERFCEYMMFYSQGDYKPAHRPKRIITAKNGVLCDSLVRDPLIEKGFSYKLFESREYLFVLEGRIDFMGYAADGETLLWMDHKLQMREHELYRKAIQFRNYSLATGLNLAVINYVRMHKKVEKNTFVRQPLSFSSLEMRYWKEELTDIYVRIAKEVASGEFIRNRGACGGNWGKPCMFVPLCEEYNPVTRAAIEKRDFTARKEWRPW